MSKLVEFYQSDIVDALYYFEYHGPRKDDLQWIEQNEDVKKLHNIIKKIHFPRLKFFLPWIRNVIVTEDLHSINEIKKYIIENPPRGKTGEKIVNQIDKVGDVINEIIKLYQKKILTKKKKKELKKLRSQIQRKYSSQWRKLKKISVTLPGISWEKKDPTICFLYPIDGRLSFKLPYADVAYIETSEKMLENDGLFLHELVKVLNYSKPLGSWVRQDKRGIRAIAYELFSEMQTIYILSKLHNRNPDFKEAVYDKLQNIWIPLIREETFFDEVELERILDQAYKMLPNHEYDMLYQLGELYTEINIVKLT
ncbi:MAG: hypothetical protein U9O98_03330 [Asgard group archaeon]|nr:hypothetical protein [Asgard group archaeon]